jgi:hypothetical protein
MNECLSICSGECAFGCRIGCTAAGRNDSAAQAECGTPVLEREATNRHVTV